MLRAAPTSTSSPKSSSSAAAMRRKDSVTFVLHPKQLVALRSKATEILYGGANRGEAGQCYPGMTRGNCSISLSRRPGLSPVSLHTNDHSSAACAACRRSLTSSIQASSAGASGGIGHLHFFREMVRQSLQDGMRTRNVFPHTTQQRLLRPTEGNTTPFPAPRALHAALDYPLNAGCAGYNTCLSVDPRQDGRIVVGTLVSCCDNAGLMRHRHAPACGHAAPATPRPRSS